jgi:trans-aconitate methyltransferase
MSTPFDEVSADYDVALAHGLSVTGEDKDYFARGRIAWLAKCLARLQEAPQHIMDFGCGTGSAIRWMLNLLSPKNIVGLDVSRGSLEIASRTCGSEQTRFILLSQFQPQAQMDLVFSNGVFHHIALEKRATNVNCMYRSLRHGGLLAFWENNPWNPGTRYVMSRIPFDRDAITLTPSEARRMLQASGFKILRTDFLFIFPRVLRLFRGIEPFLSRLPLGGQYQILCRKP